MSRFQFASQFLNSSRFSAVGRASPFGFNGLGEIVYRRTYAREGEEWKDTCERVVSGTMDMLSEHVRKNSRLCDPGWQQETAQDMMERMHDMKFLPPGRGLWAMGSALTREKKLYAALNNCGFVSTKDMATDPVSPFTFLMDASMLGVGVGFDTKGAGTVTVKPCSTLATREYVVPDSREGWVEALKILLLHYFHGGARPVFDYSLVREAGMPLKGFGGVSAGPGPLKYALDAIGELLEGRRGECLSITDITDIANIVGKCVVSGNVRRSAEIAFGEPDSEEFLDLKDYVKNPQREGHGWVSNNSVMATVGMDYGPIAKRIMKNGEPGLIWLENMRKYSRTGDRPDHRDAKVLGANPCSEQTLESYELCCLVETFPFNHDSDGDFLRTLKIAHLYAKTVTLGMTHWEATNRVMKRNRRMGVSMSGIAQYLHAHGSKRLIDLCDTGYKYLKRADAKLSKTMGVPTSIKLTSVKPSGTVSLLAGATPGLHHPISAYYIRRVRLPANSPLVSCLSKAGYFIEDAADGVPGTTVVVEIPVSAFEDDTKGDINTVDKLDTFEQMAIAALMQRSWADNAVSCTVTFDPTKPDAEEDLVNCLKYFQHDLKGISFLPSVPQKEGKTAYAQMPYEEITKEVFLKCRSMLKQIEWAETSKAHVEVKHHTFCDGAACELRAE